MFLNQDIVEGRVQMIIKLVCANLRCVSGNKAGDFIVKKVLQFGWEDQG